MNESGSLFFHNTLLRLSPTQTPDAHPRRTPTKLCTEFDAHGKSNLSEVVSLYVGLIRGFRYRGNPRLLKMQPLRGSAIAM